MSSSFSNYHEKIVIIKRLEIPKQEHVQIDYVSQNFIDRYIGDIYMHLLRKNPNALIAYFLDLPKELQIEIAKKLFETCTSNVWEMKISGLKVAIEIKAQEMWIE